MLQKNGDTWLIVGLGNPGREYERSRHNCGFRAVDILAEKLGCKIDRAKFQGLYTFIYIKCTFFNSFHSMFFKIFEIIPLS